MSGRDAPTPLGLKQPKRGHGCHHGSQARHNRSILVNHEAEAARGALAFDDAGQAARLKSPRSRDGEVHLETRIFVFHPAFMSIGSFCKKNKPDMLGKLRSIKHLLAGCVAEKLDRLA
jgi:hypothetical protein